MESTDRTQPYCFILDEAYRVVMAGPTEARGALAPLDEAGSPDALPPPIERAVRALTANWHGSPPEAETANAAVRGLYVSVAPLPQRGGNIAVLVRRPFSAIA